MRGAMGMMMGGVPELTLSASPSTSISGFQQAGPVTINVTGGPAGSTPTISWSEVSGDVYPATPSSFSTYFYPESYFGSGGIWRATVTRGAAVKTIDITVGISGYDHLDVSGPTTDIYVTADASGNHTVVVGFTVSGGSGDYTVVNSLGQPSASINHTFHVNPGDVNVPIAIACTATDNVTGESDTAGFTMYLSHP